MAEAEGGADGLPDACERLMRCCEALVGDFPAAKAGCDAQRESFKAFKGLPESARKQVGDSCTASLSAMSQFPNAPAVCSGN